MSLRNSLAFRAGDRLRISGPAWQVKNLSSRFGYLRCREPLTPAQERAAESLHSSGIAIAHISDFFPAEVFRELSAAAQARWRERGEGQRAGPSPAAAGDARPKKDSFLVELWDGPFDAPGGKPVLDLKSPFLRFSLSRELLGVVNRYLGMLAKFRAFWLQATIPVGAGIVPYASQRWHADPDDRRLVKVFLYLSDVDETAGPFTYIRFTHSGGRWRRLFPYHPKKGRHPESAFIERMIPPEDIVTATGKAGAIIFCDTSGIHRGGHATAKHRLMYTGVYTTAASALPTRYGYPPGFRPEELSSPAARYAVSPQR